MQSIEFEDSHGRKVKLSQPSGAEGWQIIIDKFYNGILFKRSGKWIAYLAEGSDLTADDVVVLGERIDQAMSR